jgi:hypothetical protein
VLSASRGGLESPLISLLFLFLAFFGFQPVIRAGYVVTRNPCAQIGLSIYRNYRQGNRAMRMTAKCMLTCLFAISCTAHVATASVIHALGDSSTSGFSQGSGVGETPRGWDFQVNAPDVVVTQLGVNEALGGAVPITLTLWDTTSETILAQTTATPSAANNWTWVDLATPVALTAGDVYSVIGWADTSEDSSSWYLFSGFPPATFEPTGTIQYLNTRFDNDVGPNTFPSFVLSGQYGVVDIGYEFAASAPEPGTLTLVGLGAFGLVAGAIRRRRLGAAFAKLN